MSRISIRDLPEPIHQLISTSAERNHRSVEGEIRHALVLYATSLDKQKPDVHETSAQIWQRGVGQRLNELFQRLRSDDFFPYGVNDDAPHIASYINEASPLALLDCLDGRGEMNFDMFDRIVQWSGCSSTWLLSGKGSMFLVPDIGSSYSRFFVNDSEKAEDINFYLIRVGGGRADGLILCIKHDTVKDVYSSGYMYSNFHLRSGMGATGSGNLKEFIRFLKINCSKYRLIDRNFQEAGLEGEIDLHHPMWYVRRATQASWLMSLFRGEDPDDWLKGYIWDDVAQLPFDGHPAE
ncbi:FitA-like ribbon-helix-helix domain-containing protein [Pseudomonas syringae]|uniref:FitA-like ribbon-helix-helix domain-containing protein n=1 Tax=Pseudomonas syringae TaxID=317 RepID=UPI003204CDB2